MVRKNRYTKLINNSLQLKSESHDIYYFEPFCQLMRQTLWAEQMVVHKDSETISADDFFHIHVIPTENKGLLVKNYKCSCKAMEDTWRSCINDQDKYLIVTSEDLLIKIQRNKYRELIEYLNKRYW